MSRRRSPRNTPTDPLAEDSATNTSRATASARPEVVEYHQALRAAGHRISLSGVRRLLAIYEATYNEVDGFLSYCLNYLDPTGEQATANALASR